MLKCVSPPQKKPFPVRHGVGDPVPANIWFLGRPTHNTDAILQAYRLLGLVLRLAILNQMKLHWAFPVSR